MEAKTKQIEPLEKLSNSLHKPDGIYNPTLGRER